MGLSDEYEPAQQINDAVDRMNAVLGDDGPKAIPHIQLELNEVSSSLLVVIATELLAIRQLLEERKQ